MIVDHGESRGPWPLSEGIDPTLGRNYRGKRANFDLGHEVRLYGVVVPGYEPFPSMDPGLFGRDPWR